MVVNFQEFGIGKWPANAEYSLHENSGGSMLAIPFGHSEYTA